MKRECRDYKKLMEKDYQGRTHEDKGQEAANVAASSSLTVEEIEDISASTISTDQREITTSWILDSGASKHIYSDQTLLNNLKCFESPQLVKLADNTTIRAYGKGMARLQSNQTSLRLDKVWYVPELATTKLISIGCLNDYGIEVTFKPGRTIKAYKDYNLVFTGAMCSGLVVLDLKPLPWYPPEASTYTAMPMIAALELVSDHTSAKETKFDL